MLAIEVAIDGKKFVFCTVYRVGNLNEPNHASIMSTIKTFYKIRNPRKMFIVGDFNLKSISWPRSEDMGNGNGTDKLFVLGLGLINVFQDLPTINVELLT